MKQLSPDTKKKTLRNKLSLTLANLPMEYLVKSNQRIFMQLLAQQEYEKAKTIFCYVSVAAEPDTRRFIETALQNGKTICVPKCKSNGLMQAYKITSLKELSPAKFGLVEPAETATRLAPEEIDFVVMPCIACDTDGRRLGHGGGYYDRYLTKTSAATVCLCHAALIQKTPLPEENFDLRPNKVLTGLQAV